ncbi:MBL fold metallo-hydrolase [Caballeronia sp. LZ043]|uniref:MBL fold metallo-hydrolase n=1 Tax=Caballeronia sp. LZ043 TaxID=3038569 RepID=UPI00285B4C49|nr:MBL fold metallo-hydrolase [Caballeronia sp. LZ043]MDR5822397.1 MBL fold metallo-hydrolase [Caballeronia sp. LZ043]
MKDEGNRSLLPRYALIGGALAASIGVAEHPVFPPRENANDLIKPNEWPTITAPESPIFGENLFDGRTPSLLRRGELTCHCLLVESDEGLLLIDTGFGLRDVADPRRRLSAFFRVMLKPRFREEMTAIRQIERLGLSADEVRHIVLIHLDFDQAGGLDDFPHAKVHMLRA